MSREAVTFAGIYLDITSRMEHPAPSAMIETLVEMANRNPGSYICVHKSGQFMVMHGEDFDTVSNTVVWVDPVDGNGGEEYYWLLGESGLRDGIWPQPLTDMMVEAYKAHSLFGIGDDYA
jgi:hypothetical protein